MAVPLSMRMRKAWNAFNNAPEANEFGFPELGVGLGNRPDKTRLFINTERSLIASIYTRIAIDVSSIDVKHVKADQNGRFLSTIDSSLNECLTVQANLDQTARAFRQDAVMTLFDKGVIAILPVDFSENPDTTGAYDIYSMRVGEIVQWYPAHVKIRAYNEKTGKREEVVMNKRNVAIVENPLYQVMNEPNSTLQRLIRKLNLLDGVDEQTSSGKLDLIIQLPYVIKSEARREQAENRRKDIELQLKGSKYGIAYTDGTERITQLNRPAENNLLNQITLLTTQLFSQLGMTEAVFNGTATEAEMLNYHNRTVEPILSSMVNSMVRSFLTKSARTQGQSIMTFRDPFKLVPVGQFAEIADKFTRNEILAPNDIRAFLGIRPSEDPRADELRNRNINAGEEQLQNPVKTNPEGFNQNGT